MNELYPLVLEPQANARLWGGERLRSRVPGFAELTLDAPIGEAWLVGADNRVVAGALAGRTLQSAAEHWGEALLGARSVARYGVKVPLLAKFLDAAEPLSVQVHPGDAYAAAREVESGHLGKAEAWLILEAEPGSSVVWGFNRPISQGEVRARAEAGTLEEVLNVVPVTAGDVIYNPAGTVHAVGAGLLIFEIQQASDLTYRLYDYGRTDTRGQPRELHLDKALDVLALSSEGAAKLTPIPTGAGVTELARTPHFLMERLDVDGELGAQTGGETLHLLTVLEGRPILTWEGGRLELGPAASLVVPAALGAYRLSGEGTLVRCSLPE